MEIFIRGHRVLIDDEDFEEVSKSTWHPETGKHNGKTYFRTERKTKGIRLHRLVMNAEKGVSVDHINGDTADNRKINLRFATTSENNRNAKKYKSNSSGYKGVSWRGGRSKRWRVRIVVDGKRQSVGNYLTKEEAFEAYCDAAKRHYGEFARFE